MKQSQISPPGKIPFILRPAVAAAEKISGKRMEAARILSWSIPASLAAGVLEWGMEKAAVRILTPRAAKLIRMQVSFTVSCPFCIDMNSFQYEKAGIIREEAVALSEGSFRDCESFSPGEKVMLQWVSDICATPISVSPEILGELIKHYSDREMTVMGALAGKVNFWGRLMQAYQIPPAGYGGLKEFDRF